MLDPLDEIARLPRNWDGYDGGTFLPATIDHARRVRDALTAAGFDVEVTPNPNGTVSLEWQNNHVEVGATRGIGYVREQ